MIVGQGLAGCLLTRSLMKRGANCLMSGKTLPLAATPVAAGIMNPVTGKRLAKSWLAEHFLPHARQFYRELSNRWKVPLLREGHILRFIKNEEERVRFRKRRLNASFAPYLGEEFPPGHWESKGWRDPLGSYEIREVAWVDVEKVADTMRRELREQGAWKESLFDHRDLQVLEKGGSWENVEATCVVFCEGAKVVENPWFNEWPFAPTRGETLTLKAKPPAADEILQSGFWLLSSADDSLRAGSTYDHDDLTSGPSRDGREKILEGLAGFLVSPPQVIGQGCGLRAGTRDRLPILGRHPANPSLALFNGFGSKGASWIPKLAEDFADHLLQGKPLAPEIDLLRFDSLDHS